MRGASLIVSVVAVILSAGAAGAQPASPYAGQEQRTIKALSNDEIGDLRAGRGMGLAKAAELNSYPGPLHVLQLAKELELSDAQRTATQGLYADMLTKAHAIGRRIIDAECALDQAFADGRIETAVLGTQVSAIATLQGELRAAHLEAHLAQRALLTPEQIARYDRLRGYGGQPAPQHGHRSQGGG